MDVEKLRSCRWLKERDLAQRDQAVTLQDPCILPPLLVVFERGQRGKRSVRFDGSTEKGVPLIK